MKKTIHGLMLGLLLLAGISHARGQDAKIEARLNPERITLGESSTLDVTITGGGGDPKLPDVDGLRFVKVSQSQQFQIINFSKPSVHISLGYQVQATKPGEYQIPPIQLALEGNKTIQTQALKLTVLKPTAVTPPPAAATGGDTTLPQDEQEKLLFVRLSKLPDKLYTGQVVPVSVRVYIRDGLRVKTFDAKINGEAFSIKPLEFHQEQEQIQGIPYIVLTASTTLSAVKQGSYPVRAVSDLLLLVHQKSANDDFFGNNPFFQQFEPRQVKRESTPQTIEVLPLPEKDKPASFAGAIGRFELSVKATPDEVHTGDPLTLKMEISGIGNFDHVNAPVVASSPVWKSYPAGNHFTPSDAAGYDGKKVFDQPLIPQSAEAKSLPPVEFSYFDPVESKYVVLKPEPPAVRIIGTSGIAGPLAPVVAPAAAPSSPTTPSTPTLALLPNQIEEGTLVQNYRPLIREPWFWAVQSLPLALGLVGLFLNWRYRSHVANPARQLLRQQQVRQQTLLTAMEQSRQAGDSAALVEAGCRLLCETLAHRRGVSPETINAAALRSQPQGEDAGLADLLDLGDAVRYSGRRLDPSEMDHFIQRIKATSTGINS